MIDQNDDRRAPTTREGFEPDDARLQDALAAVTRCAEAGDPDAQDTLARYRRGSQ